MKRNLLAVWLLLCACLLQARSEIKLTALEGLPQAAYVYRDTLKNIHGRFSAFSPFFLVYPDAPCSLPEAEQLVKELGLDHYVTTYAGAVCVVNPVGTAYDNRQDLAAFEALLNKLYIISNLKVIGIGRGATFVNQSVSQHAGAVAGIVSLGGKPGRAGKEAAGVPAYVGGKNSRRVAAAYIRQNDAEQQTVEGTLTTYANAGEPLLRVAVNNDESLSLRASVDEAWRTVLSRNFRFNNYQHTWYTGCNFGQYGPYELEPYIMPEEWGIERRVVEQELDSRGLCLWYEYHPAATLKAAPGTVPLVVLLHGNNNDPRTQAETSGFIELCAEENFVVVELEWQGNGYAFMGADGIEQAIYHLLKTYPQLDATRIYAEGLSAGGFMATNLGISKSHLFAAVGGHSGALVTEGYRFSSGAEPLWAQSVQKRGCVEMPYISVCGTCDEVVPFVNKDNWQKNVFFRAWQAYQTMNGLDVTAQPDFGRDATFGIELADRETVRTSKGLSVETGVLYKGNVPLIKLVAINDYGHWNFKPAARMMWDYFKHFSREAGTGRLIYSQPE